MTETPLDNSNERRGGPIDRNPLMSCAKCGQEERWQDINDDRGRDGGWQVSNDPEVALLCPSCNTPFLSGTEMVHALAREGHHRWAEIAANVETGDESHD